MKKILMVITLIILLPLYAIADSSVTVKWNANSESDLEGYYVYKVDINKGDTTGNHVLKKDGGTPNGTIPAGSETLTFSDQPDGFYSFVVTAYDTSGNESDASTEVIERIDTTPPVITITGDSTITIERGSTFTDPGVTAIDNLDGDLTEAVVTSGTVDSDTAGTYTITYSVSDETPLAATSITRTVEVVDNASPSPPSGVEVIWSQVITWFKCKVLHVC